MHPVNASTLVCAPADLNAIRGARCDLIRCRVGGAAPRRNLLMSDCERFRDRDERPAELKIGPCTECGSGIIALSFVCRFHVQFAVDFSEAKISLHFA